MVEFGQVTVEVYLNEETKNIKVVDTDKDEMQEQVVLSDDFEEIQEAMRVPGFGLGMVLIKIGRAFSRAVGGGSSAK